MANTSTNGQSSGMAKKLTISEFDMMEPGFSVLTSVTVGKMDPKNIYLTYMRHCGIPVTDSGMKYGELSQSISFRSMCS